MALDAEACGLALDLANLGELSFQPDAFAAMHDSRKLLFRILPSSLREIGMTGSAQRASDTAVLRMNTRSPGDYRPSNLEKFVVAKPGAVAAISEPIAALAADSAGAIA